MPPPSKLVVVVDDDPDVRKVVAAYLSDVGVELAFFAEGKSAIAAMGVRPPDLVCLDLLLPDVSGFSISEQMKKNATLANVPILMMSARGSVADRAHAEELGVTQFLQKPFRRAPFQKLIRALLELPSVP
ncbi:MAG: two-component system response regulator [Myxococcaceae bacterium]